MEREKLGSRLGFILISAGCAIGIGNVWKFPYVAGLYGGGVFLFFYLLFLLMLGLPVMTMEFATGLPEPVLPGCWENWSRRARNGTGIHPVSWQATGCS